MQKEAEFLHYSDRANRVGNKIQARISFLRAIKGCPAEGDINFRFAKFLKDEKGAEFRFRKASIMMPKRSLIFTDWALFLDRQGKLEGQEELFRKATELNPDSVECLCNLGAVLTEKGRFEEALALFEKAHQKKPYHLNCNNSLGSLYLILGKHEKAVLMLKKAIDLQKSYYLPYMNLSLVYGCMGMKIERNENFEEGKSLLERGNGEDEKKWIVREYKRLLNSAKENLLKEENENDDERRHNEMFSKALKKIIYLLEE